MLEDGLQLVVEQLAERLGRSVIVDDPALRPLAVSAQLGQVDQSRIDAVLQRRTSDPIRAMITEHGLSQARGRENFPAWVHGLVACAAGLDPVLGARLRPMLAAVDWG